MLSGAASPAVSRRAGVWWGLQPYLRAISIGVHLSMSTQPQSVLRTPHSLRGIVAHLLVETQYCWALTDKQPNETDGEKTIPWRALPDAEGEKFVCGRRGVPLLKGCIFWSGVPCSASARLAG